MVRHTLAPRDNWTNKIEMLGFSYHSQEGAFWDESIYYEFTLAEVETIEQATQSLYACCLELVDWVISSNLFDLFNIPPTAQDAIRNSWKEEAIKPSSIYGRFDFQYEPFGTPKLLEFNADTPTTLFEASVIQWDWLEDCFPQADQFNSIHETLIEAWKRYHSHYPQKLYFSCVKNHIEDLTTVEYLRDTAIQAGLETQFIFIEDIGWNPQKQSFVDWEEEVIPAFFKLYPWEWLLDESFADELLGSPTRVLEPAWKMILSNKAILPLLWEMFPQNENLLPAYFEPSPKLHNRYVMKPKLSREGANVTIVDQLTILSTPGEYGEEGYIYQAYQPLPSFDFHYPVIGSWVVNGQACGMGIREADSAVTDNMARFVPHLFKEA
jgi:glutathionylspermidine synthase